ncbi:MAG: RNA methyltransferase, partial [Leptolyngbyaceae cyanobacterium CAN_BIN12]|nr:RNA methyltransferase [Leptolyngbyaceae cyanobacterium CAN_BIN12]
IRQLHRAKERREQQLFLLEGTHLIEAACLADRPFNTVCHTSNWQLRYPELLQQIEQRTQRLELVSPEVLRAIATTVEPDGIIATVERSSSAVPVFHQLGLVLETIQDPGNLGTIIRTAAAAGADGLLLSADSVDLDHPKVLRASAGQWFRLPMATNPDLPAAIALYRQQGFQIVATLPTADRTYWDVDFCKPTLLLLGNEGAGLSPDLAALADYSVQIPLAVGVESLNVAIATALLLYEAKRQKALK